MSSLLFDRLLLTFINVKHRLEKLLNICRIYENSAWKTDDSNEEFYRFYGPDRADIEDLENSILSISKLIENFQHEQNTNGYCEPFTNCPLCENGWRLKDIEQLDKQEILTLNIIHQISLHTLSQSDDDSDEEQYITKDSDVNINFTIGNFV